MSPVAARLLVEARRDLRVVERRLLQENEEGAASCVRRVRERIEALRDTPTRVARRVRAMAAQARAAEEEFGQAAAVYAAAYALEGGRASLVPA